MTKAHSSSDNLGDRMKAYENCFRHYLPRRQAVILRLDMCHAHSFTKGFRKPYDVVFASSIQDTMQRLCEDIMGVKFGYCQSDEISLVITDYDSIKTEAWFSYNIQKMSSVAASIASVFFYKSFIANSFVPDNDIYIKTLNTKIPLFDCRCFILPIHEVNNYFYWREMDCQRNSIATLAQCHFTHNQLHKKSSVIMREMLQEVGDAWEDRTYEYQRGVGCYKTVVEKKIINPRTGQPDLVERRVWQFDRELPDFSKYPDYINRFITFD